VKRSPIYSPASLIFALLVATAGLSATAEAASKSSAGLDCFTAKGTHYKKVEVTHRKAAPATSSGSVKPSGGNPGIAQPSGVRRR
jgi:hypothetical protein